MRASLLDLIQGLRAQNPPPNIWQKPFEYDSSRYKRLCNLQGKAPNFVDLCCYAEDMLYEPSPLQPDLLRYLLPICLEVWRKDLLRLDQGEYGGFVAHLWPALARKSVQDALSANECATVATFMADSILDAIDQEPCLSFRGSRARPYDAFAALNAFCIVFPTLPALWEIWWAMETPGQACTVLQYLSCLLYEKNSNPIFAPWTPLEGGGPPSVGHPEGHIFDLGWRKENVKFLRATLTPDYVQDRLRFAAQATEGVLESPVPQQMLEDFEEQKTLLEIRLNELPSLLLEPWSLEQDWVV